MKTPHKHAMFIKAWADGEVIEVYDAGTDSWVTLGNPSPAWTSDTYRIKPEPTKDVFTKRKAYFDIHAKQSVVRKAEHWELENVLFTFDGATGKLKKVEIVCE